MRSNIEIGVRNHILGRGWHNNDEFLLLQMIISSHIYSHEEDFILKPSADS